MIGKNSVLLENPSEWYDVLCFLETKLNIKLEHIFIVLSRLERTGLITKNQQSQINPDPSKRMSSDPSAKQRIDSYISTPYFEIIYNLSDDLENYLNECI